MTEEDILKKASDYAQVFIKDKINYFNMRNSFYNGAKWAISIKKERPSKELKELRERVKQLEKCAGCEYYCNNNTCNYKQDK